MVVSPEERLKRYLYITNEANIYYPGNRWINKRYTRETVPSLQELIADKKEDAVFDLLKQVHEDNRSCFPDALLFVLSELAREKTLRTRALELANLLCQDAYSFMSFLKFAFEFPPKLGYGRALRRFIRSWYVNKDHLRLAEIVGQNRRYRGWNHSDLIKLAHVKCSEPAKAASFKYAISGLEQMVKDFGNVEEAKDVVSYLTTVDTYKRKTDATEVAAKIDSYMLGIEHVNFCLLGHKNVWIALLKQMPVSQVLDHLQYMSRRKMFRNGKNWDFVLIDSIIEALTKPFANRTGISATRAFIELINYDNAGRVKLDLANKMKQVTKKPPILNSELQNGLSQLVENCLKDMKPTGKKIMLAVELSQEMVKRRCNYSRYVNLIDAAGFVAFSLNRIETTDPKIHTFNSNGMKELTFGPGVSVKGVIEAFKNDKVPDSNSKSVADEFLMNWLRENNKNDEFDVVIIIKSYMDNNSLHSLTKVGNTNKKTRFVVVDLCGIPKNCKPPDKRNLFLMSGFDEKFMDALTLYISSAF